MQAAAPNERVQQHPRLAADVIAEIDHDGADPGVGAGYAASSFAATVFISATAAARLTPV
jgi:hypothetical protein